MGFARGISLPLHHQFPYTPVGFLHSPDNGVSLYRRRHCSRYGGSAKWRSPEQREAKTNAGRRWLDTYDPLTTNS